MKRCSTSISHQEIQGKRTVGHYKPMRKTKITDWWKQVLVRMWRNWNFYHFQWGWRMVQLLQKTICIIHTLSYDPVILLLGIYPRRHLHKDLYMDVCRCFLCNNWSSWKYPSTSACIRKLWNCVMSI